MRPWRRESDSPDRVLSFRARGVEWRPQPNPRTAAVFERLGHFHPLRSSPVPESTVSEYQYYDFMALDRTLSDKERRQLRAISTRATITATRFTNRYDFGDLKANATELVARYFDAHLYLANWGTRVLAFRFPTRLLPPAVAEQYCRGRAARVVAKRGHVVVEFCSEEASDSEWVDDDNDGSGLLAPLLPLRAEIASGDLRALYLAWLMSVQTGELARSAKEPPCPPGLRTLSPALEAMLDFLRIDARLLEVARRESVDLEPPRRIDLARWVASLSSGDLRKLATGLLEGSDPGLRFEALRRFQNSRVTTRAPSRRRSVGEMLDAAEKLRDGTARGGAQRAASRPPR